MRYLILTLNLLAALNAFSQSGPWQLVVDGTPAIETPQTITGSRYNVFLSPSFETKSEKLNGGIYDPATGRFNAELNDVIGVRFGFSYRMTPGADYAEFALFADVGTGIDPVKLGSWIESRPGVWRDVNPEVTIFAGDSVAANGVQLYFSVFGGSVDVAAFDVYTEIKHREQGPQVAALEIGSDLALPLLTTPVDLVFPLLNLDPLWSSSLGVLSYQGSPSFVDLRFNAKVFIANGANFQRPNYVAQIVRENDGKIIAQAASLYIRDSNDHEEASWNISVIDPSPPPNPSYKVVTYRETASATQVVNIESEGASFTAIAY